LNDRDRASSSHTEPFRSGATGTDETVADPRLAHLAELTESSAPRDQEGVRQYLDHPNLRRLFFVKNPRGGQTAQTVASIVKHTTSHGFFKITIAQGIVIDARHPDQATVFALVVSANDVNNLQDQLKVALPGLFEENPVEPGIVTQLADLGQVESFAAAPLPMAAVSISHDDLALRTKVASGAETGDKPVVQSGKSLQNRPNDEQESLEPPTVEQEQSAPLPAKARPRGSDSRPDAAHALGSPREVRTAQTPALNGRERVAKREAGRVSRDSGAASSQAGEAKASQTAKGSLAVPDDGIVVLVWVYESSPS
jgi:hypothetical protein